MKEVFTHSNTTLQDVAKTALEKAWVKSTSGNQNKKKTTHTTLRQGALSGSGYAYPGLVSTIIQNEEDEE